MGEVKCSEYQILELCSYVGKIFLKNGAEVYRTEDVIERVGNFAGYRVETFVTLTCIVVSVVGNDEICHSRVTRIKSRGLNLYKICIANQLIRDIEKNSYLEFYKKLREIDNNYFIKFPRYLLGCTLVGMSFGIVFGGGQNEAIVGAVGGFFLSIITALLNKYDVNSVLVNIAGSMTCTTIACIATYIGYTNKTSVIIIACLMVLVPGLPFANSIRDFIAGDLIAGSSRLMEVIMVAASLSVGVGLVFKIFRHFGGVIY